MSKAQTNGFHAGGAKDFHTAVEKDPAYREKREAEKRQRIEGLIAGRLEDFRRAGYWRRKAMLKKIHFQVNQEFSKVHCLF